MADLGRARGVGVPRLFTPSLPDLRDFDISDGAGNMVDEDITYQQVAAVSEAYIALRQFLEPLLSRVT